MGNSKLTGRYRPDPLNLERIMKKKPLYFLLALGMSALVSCHGGAGSEDSAIATKEKSNKIALSEAISKIRPVKLSEIVDSITYLPLSNDHLLSDAKIILSDNYLFVGSSAFDWKGNYLFEIGSRGQGAGEEVDLNTVLEADQSFYSLADKLIAYDNKGEFAGRERLVIDFHPLDMGRADTFGIAMYTLDSLYFWDTNLNFKKAMRVVPDWPEKSTMFSSNRFLRFFFPNRDSVLFYNYINDTIYRVLNNDIQPRWVMDLKEDKMPIKYLLGDELKRVEGGAKYFLNSNLSNWEYLRDTDNKIRAFGVYESEDYVFVYWFRLFDFWQLRQLPPTKFQIAYFDKQTEETIAVEGDGFVDNISSLGIFYPLLGIHDNCLINTYWPFELQDRLDSLQRIGKPVDKKLQHLLNQMKPDDNPIVVMAHLKPR